MNSLKFERNSKTSSFKKFKLFLCKYYSRFINIYKNSEHLNQFLNIGKLLKNANISQNILKNANICCFK